MHRVTLRIGETDLVLETGRMAKQANGSVFAQCGGSSVLATVCCGSKPVEDLDYVPLSVEYNERYYAAGKIPGGFLKREARPKDKEILVSRLIDRPMRPLFDKAFKREIQIVPTVVSTDMINPPDIIGIIASSTAVHISDIPFAGPVGAVRVSQVDGKLVVNPTFQEIERSTLDIVVAGTSAGITMVEGGAKQVSEELLLEAIEIARKPIAEICKVQEELRALCGKAKLPLVADDKRLKDHDAIWAFAYPLIEKACFVKGKFERRDAIDAAVAEVKAKFADSLAAETDPKLFGALVEDIETKVLRMSIVERGVRVDGRGPADIRPITCEIGVLPRVHGSALFTRGETQALAVATLGTVFDEQIMDDIDGDKRATFMLHYNFPPFSVGETGRLSTGRREIGHGHLAQRALQALVPSKEEFPYTLRVVSEVLESNGSSSMATVCGGTLAMMNAGVPIAKPIAGIAMGLVQENGKNVVLSDILGEEDHLGDMDFKVAGTADGITGFQMDIKLQNVDPAMMKVALAQAREGRLHILSKMNAVINKPASEVSEHAPRILTFRVDTDKIGLLIGPGGKTIKGISEKFDVTTNIENDGTVTIYGKTKVAAESAKAAFLGLMEEPEVGRTYMGTVRRIMDFGAFIEFMPGKEGLCHISKMSTKRIASVTEVLSMNQEVMVKLVEVDKMGRVNLALVLDESEPK